MKISNLLSFPNVNNLGPILRFDWLPANITALVAAGIILTTMVVAMQHYQESSAPEAKSVAWYMANPKAALAKNKECYDNPLLKSTENCQFSLQALEITHKGPNS